MNSSNREKQNDYMVDFRDRSALTREDDYARNEYSSDQKVSGIGDFDSLLYYAPTDSQATQTAQEQKQVRVEEPRAYDYAEEDSLPSQRTMSYSSHAQIKGKLPIENTANIYEYESIRARDEDKQYKINSKGKVLIAVYAIVVLTIFALIVLNTRLLRNMNNDVAMLETQVQELTTEKQQVESELAFLSSDAEISKKALEMGMIK